MRLQLFHWEIIITVLRRTAGFTTSNPGGAFRVNYVPRGTPRVWVNGEEVKPIWSAGSSKPWFTLPPQKREREE